VAFYVAPDAMPASLVSAASVKSFVDRPFPLTLSTLLSMAAGCHRDGLRTVCRVIHSTQTDLTLSD
jgi:hypothetical protein